MRETRNHQLSVGDRVQLKRHLLGRLELLYAGMVNEQVFSLVIIRTRGHQALACNLYLPVSQRHVSIAEVPITIHAVSPATLQLSTD